MADLELQSELLLLRVSFFLSNVGCKYDEIGIFFFWLGNPIPTILDPFSCAHGGAGWSHSAFNTSKAPAFPLLLVAIERSDGVTRAKRVFCAGILAGNDVRAQQSQTYEN